MGRKKADNNIPTFDKLLVPTIKALVDLGGSGTIEEINSKVYEIAELKEEVLQIPHGEEGSTTELDYRLGWSRSYLKKYGLLENSSRGIWALLQPDIDINRIDPIEIVKSVREQSKTSRAKPNDSENQMDTIQNDVTQEINNSEEWKEQLLNILYGISPGAFERLAQRLLRESGFFQVEITGKSGDGGIDGKGIVRVSGLLSFHVIFQCKRYKGSVSPSQIRDFRGAMQGRADKGLVITTGTFTREAIREATRDGAPPIDLIDGHLLCEKMKELKLGVSTELIETVVLNREWLSKL